MNPAVVNTREHSAKVFGIGLSRTGTTSLTSALVLLGFRAEHFPCDDATRREISEFVRAPQKFLPLTILRDLDALTDTPIAITYQGLDHAYPGSKFILTVRDSNSWLQSCEAYWSDFLGAGMANVRPELTTYIEMINDTIYGVQDFDAQHFSRAYAQHVAEVHTYFRHRPDDLLVLDLVAGQGWEQLCEFLRLPQPRVKFPHNNISARR